MSRTKEKVDVKIRIKRFFSCVRDVFFENKYQKNQLNKKKHLFV
jgi:hypothetical protein